MTDKERATKIMQLKEALGSAKSEYDRLSGQLENYTESLKNDYEVADLKEAKEKLQTMETEKTKLTDQIDNLIPTVEEALSRWM